MKFFLTLSFILLATPTWAQKKYADGSGITQPSMEEFRFLSCYEDRIDKAIEKGIVDTSVVYLGELVLKEDTFYAFQRYFSGGVAFRSAPYLKTPQNEDFNNLTYGKWVVYVYNQDRDFIVESYVNHPTPWRVFHYEKVDNGDLKVIQSEARAMIFCKHRSWLTGSKKTNSRVKMVEDVNLWNYEIDWE